MYRTGVRARVHNAIQAQRILSRTVADFKAAPEMPPSRHSKTEIAENQESTVAHVLDANGSGVISPLVHGTRGQRHADGSLSINGRMWGVQPARTELFFRHGLTDQDTRCPDPLTNAKPLNGSGPSYRPMSPTTNGNLT